MAAAIECQGFLKFTTRARNELKIWFGPYCQNNLVKMAAITNREWEGMDDFERKPFIKAEQIDLRGSSSRPPSGSNSFISYLLQKRYAHNQGSSLQDQNNSGAKLSFNAKFLKDQGVSWKLLSDEDKSKFSNFKISDLGMDHVIKKRGQLHEMYCPRELSILEFILKTKPKQPLNSRLWFFKSENLSIKAPESREKWLNLDPETREIYDKCAALDRRRFSFEKNAWLTKLLTLDFDSDELTLSDFEPIDIKAKLESLGSMVDLCKDLPKSIIGLKRPREPFSLFIEAYRIQIRDARPEFQFGKHLRECSEAWSKLTEEEKQVYKDQSKKLKEERQRFLQQELKSCNPTSLTIDFFNPSKSIHGPCRPSHLLPKLPSPISLWGKACNIPQKDRKVLWADLPQSEKDKYEEQHRQLKEDIIKQSKKLEEKLEYIKELIRKAKDLERIKRELHLVASKKSD